MKFFGVTEGNNSDSDDPDFDVPPEEQEELLKNYLAWRAGGGNSDEFFAEHEVSESLKSKIRSVAAVTGIIAHWEITDGEVTDDVMNAIVTAFEELEAKELLTAIMLLSYHTYLYVREASE